jgi:dipeptidyl-peptidase-3
MPSAEDELYITPILTPVCALDATEAFNGLTSEEKKYLHCLSTASWAGALACLVQCSVESPKVFGLFQRLFTADPPGQLREKAVAAGVSADDFEAFMQYVACFYGNMGNYLSFGDTKFVPRCPKPSVSNIIGCSSVPSLAAEWECIAGLVYDLSGDKKQMGLEGAGISTYYSNGISKDKIQLVQDFLTSQNLGDQAYNTRIFDRGDVLELAIASALVKPPATHEFNGTKIEVTYGDHQPFMKSLADNIEAALPFVPADRPAQKEMLQHYVTAFRGGNIEDHKNSQRSWVKDMAPPVETNIGFIESYRDPFGTRGEFEGFVAVVNREQSRKFQVLVDNATDFIKRLPWSEDFEKDTFTRPDFTALDVVSFASSGIPAGINIPNYDDIRGELGFKNVSLSNVLSASSSTEKITFLSEADEIVFREWRGKSFEVQVAIHELLGHGSGKLLKVIH